MTDKTASQQELAFKLGVAQTDSRALLNSERKRLILHAAKTALAATLCWWLAGLFGMQDGYWGAISAIIVLQSNFGATITASRDRILGTVIGAIFGFAFSLFGSLPWNYILAVFAAVALCGALGLRSSSRLAGVTITIVMLVAKGGSHWTLALDRVGQCSSESLSLLRFLHSCFPIGQGCGYAMDWRRSSWFLAAISRLFCRAFAARPTTTCRRDTKTR